LAKKTKKHDADQKNKKGFDSAVLNQEFAHEFGSAATNKIKKDKSKKENAAKNNGEFKG
jgi:transposase